ncbi:MAG: hypothetical protein VKJ06_08125 [Vampirovibrionales bacterium]|nr:hypothetical protein [Vampirovibrionales bacterium]
MAKAIHWPLRFRQVVLTESDQTLHTAFRPSRLYYDGGYWTPGEIVDIRVNHLVTRKAKIMGELKLCAVQDLLPDDCARHKLGLQTVPEILAYLQETYPEANVTPETLLTVVTYQNLPLDPSIIETASSDPHM